MRIVEIFESIQGEGRYMGMPAVFVRTSGCNLRCSFCDSKSTWKQDFYQDMDIGEIIHTVLTYNAEIVVITGGEPTIHGDDLYRLAHQLKQCGKKIHLETNGTNDVDDTDFDWIVCSPKEEGGYRVCPEADELKYVVTEDFDVEKAISSEVLNQWGRGRVWLQPDGYNMKKMWEKAVDIVTKYPELRVGAQLHVLMEVK